MNKVKAVFSKIKLKDYEKQWLLSWVLWGLSTVGLTHLVGLVGLVGVVQEIVFGFMGLVWVVWAVINGVGALYCIISVVAEWIRNLSGDSWIVKTVDWFNTNDRD